MNKKTDFPDLQRLPDHNHLKHFLNWLWNKPRWLFEDLYEKYFLNKRIVLEEARRKLEVKELELIILKIKLKELKFYTQKK